MYRMISDFMASEGITDYAAIPFSACRVTFPELLARTPELTPKSVLLYTVPYYGGECGNLSVYAASEDYHLFFSEFSKRLISHLKQAYPDSSAVAYVDHSPIDERDAAARAGLGVIGQHGLLINRRYSSFIFIGEVICNIPTEQLPHAADPRTPQFCEGCGVCRAACPTGILRGLPGSDCLSAVTQRKGELSEAELDLMHACHTVWGCDLCQLACPHTKRAIKDGSILSPIPFFRENRTPHLTYRQIEEMPKEVFSRRAYAWRGRRTLLRNLSAYEDREKEQF